MSDSCKAFHAEQQVRQCEPTLQVRQCEPTLQQTSSDALTQKIYDYLIARYDYHCKTYSDTVNTYMVKRREQRMKEDLNAIIHVCYDALTAVINNVEQAQRVAYVEHDICAICVNMFRPFFTADGWINELHQRHKSNADAIRLTNNIFEDPHGLYCSVIEYLEQFVADMSA